MTPPKCKKCGVAMAYLVGNSGLEAYWCAKCGRALLADNGGEEYWRWLKPQEAKGW